MSETLDLFKAALGLAEPWRVTRSDFNVARGRLDLYLDFPRGARFACAVMTLTEVPQGGSSKVPTWWMRCPIQLLKRTVDAHDPRGGRHWRCGQEAPPAVVRRRHHSADEAGNPGRAFGSAGCRRIVADRGSRRHVRDGAQCESWPAATRTAPPAVRCDRQCWLA